LIIYPYQYGTIPIPSSDHDGIFIKWKDNKPPIKKISYRSWRNYNSSNIRKLFSEQIEHLKKNRNKILKNTKRLENYTTWRRLRISLSN